MDFITSYDKEVGEAIQAECGRQRRNLELIASENIVSEPVMMAMGTVLTNKYAEGYPGKRYYGGCQYVDVLETIAIERAKKLFPYGVDDEGFIDYDELERKAKEAKPKLIVAGASAYARTIDFKRFREIADEVGAYLMVDMAHIAGLVAAGEHPSPIPYADVVTTTTHKTLRGPRGGLILANKEAAEKFNFNKAIFPGTQGGPLEHVIAAKAVCLGEALKPEFKEYAHQVVLNAKALADALQKQGFKILTGGTDNHLMLLDLRGMDISGKELQNRCDEVFITLNKNTVPNDPRSPFVTSGVRIGTPAVTTRGLKEEDMPKIAECIWLAATDFENKKEYIKAEVTKLCDKYPLYE